MQTENVLHGNMPVSKEEEEKKKTTNQNEKSIILAVIQAETKWYFM